MGKFKVSFTTALFVFSFIVCVIVAVVFVDRAPTNDYDSFYDKDEAGAADRSKQDARDKAPDAWDSSNASASPAAQRTAAPGRQTADESSFADLPIDPHLAGMAVPVAAPAQPAATANPMSGRTPEEIARAVMGQAGVNAAAEAATIPGMAVPAGIATPAIAQTPAATVRPAAPSYLPMQSNVGGIGGPIGTGGPGAMPPGTQGYNGSFANPASGPPAVSSNITNATGGWNPLSQVKATPANVIGYQSPPADPQSGMMISSGKTKTGAEAPVGFDSSPTVDNSAAPAPGGIQNQLLMPPQPQSGTNKWELPPAPTLRPPPVLDPDQRRSEADEIKPESPDSLNPDGSSGQAIAVSETTPSKEKAEEQAPEVIATVKDKTLTADQAIKLAKVRFALNDKTLTQEDRKDEAKKAAEEWTHITAAAELARKQDLNVGAPEVEQYAAMRPDFDPAAWQKSMADHGFSETEIRAQLTDIALSEKLIEHQFQEEFTDKELQAAYDKAPSKYKTPHRIRLQEIYKEKPNDEKRVEKVQSEMRRLRRQAASGTDFGLLARQTSDAPTSSKGGDLGWIDPEQDSDKDRDKAIADLKPGEVTKVIEEPDGYRIYKLAEEKQATDDFEGGKDLLIAELKKPVRENCYNDSLEKLDAPPLDAASRLEMAMAKEAEASTDEKTETAKSDDAEKNTAESKADPKAAERHARAQEVLAAAARRRQAATQPAQQQNIATATAPAVVTHQPGVQNQLLYAPGTQVQQMAGGQPAPVYQSGGQTPAPLQSPVSAPARISVNYPPGAAGQPQQPNAAMSFDNPEYASAAQMNAASTAGDAAAQSPATTSHSNGWTVTKSVHDNNSRTAAQSGTRRQQQPQARPADLAVASSVPPGFEGSGASSNAAPAPQAQQPAQQEESRGLIGNVKSFFGGFRN